jgi:protein transport protein DSL1/ZW10
MLAMYRATAAKHYSNDVAGNMLIYNDCTRIADQLRQMLDAQAEKDKQSDSPQAMRPSALLYLENDIKAIEGFGKRAYGTEMESQRTIIRDILDGAQGFIHCTEHPFAAVCDEAVAATLDRMREVHRNWKGILSHSALLQSVGSILAAVTGKMIMDIEDMNDISEEASQRLRHFCLEIGKISDLFVAADGSHGSGDLTSIYAPNWFKFQYLSEILDGSLADIKYLWTDGELRLEFEADEVIDLIKALFAESDHRRRAISEIRRTATRG